MSIFFFTFYLSAESAGWVYCVAHTAFTLFSRSLDFSLQSVDFLFGWVGCHILVCLENLVYLLGKE
jgi:hypothetical protein